MFDALGVPTEPFSSVEDLHAGAENSTPECCLTPGRTKVRPEVLHPRQALRSPAELAGSEDTSRALWTKTTTSDPITVLILGSGGKNLFFVKSSELLFLFVTGHTGNI